MPRITIVLPVYNHERYVEETLQSIFAQDYSDYQIVAVNDGSTDGSTDVLNRHQSRLNVMQCVHGGPAAARNRGIQATDSEFVAFMDADDLCTTNRLRVSIEKLEADRIDFVAGTLSFINSRGQALPGSWTCPAGAANDYWASLLERNWIGTPSVMIRRKILDRSGVFDEKFTHSEDYDLWLRIGREHRIGYIQNPLVKCRRHELNTSMRIEDHQRFERMALQKVDRREARQAFNRLYAKPVQRCEAWIWFLLRRGDAQSFDEAIFAINQYPDSPSLRFALGVSQYEAGRYHDALLSFHALKDEDAASLHNAGVLFNSCGDRETAIRYLKAALQRRPDYYDARHNLAALRDGSNLRLTRRPFRQNLVPMFRRG